MDLTKIEKPFGLLDDSTSAALMLHGGPIEVFTHEGVWAIHPNPAWRPDCVYRVKPAPPKPREYWLGCAGGYRHVYDTAAEAQTYADHNRNVEIIHVREVL